jgi:NADPH-dependent 2,4-dienoyl-CoA reductase/sulfur reductase-like enzyme
MIRQGLLDWQWRDYSDKHRSRTNLLLHIVAVPLFQIGSVVLVWALIARSVVVAGGGVLAMAAALVIQGRGHRREGEAPVPFDGAADFVSRFVAEQWVTFPRFVFSGGWRGNLKGSREGQAD